MCVHTMCGATRAAAVSRLVNKKYVKLVRLVHPPPHNPLVNTRNSIKMVCTAIVFSALANDASLSLLFFRVLAAASPPPTRRRCRVCLYTNRFTGEQSSRKTTPVRVARPSRRRRRRRCTRADGGPTTPSARKSGRKTIRRQDAARSVTSRAGCVCVCARKRSDVDLNFVNVILSRDERKKIKKKKKTGRGKK